MSSGTYFMAPARLDRRMMSQMDLMAELTDCWVAWRLPLPFPFLGLLGIESKDFTLEVLEATGCAPHL